MADIFVSYSSEDRERIRPLVEALEGDGFSVWWDRRIHAGTTYDREIESAIQDAACMVVAWSATSIESEYVRSEVEEGARRDILVPVLFDDVLPPLAHRRRQVTRASTYHEITRDVREIQQFLANSPDYISTMGKADEIGAENLTEEEINRWSGFVVSDLVVFENCFHSGREGIAHEELWPSARRGLKSLMRRNPSHREWFSINDSLTTSFRAEVSKICAEIDAEQNSL